MTTTYTNRWSIIGALCLQTEASLWLHSTSASDSPEPLASSPENVISSSASLHEPRLSSSEPCSASDNVYRNTALDRRMRSTEIAVFCSPSAYELCRTKWSFMSTSVCVGKPYKYTHWVSLRTVKCHPKFNLVEGVLSRGFVVNPIQ